VRKTKALHQCSMRELLKRELTKAVLEIKDTVLLEDRAEHGLDNNAGSRVGDERRLLVELLGEEVDTEVAVLASRSRNRDLDDLARAAL
jgi:hypothetical protein